MTLVHKCRFIPFMPSAITALAYHQQTLAVVRENSCLELWNLQDKYLEKQLFVNQKVEALAFIDSFLICATLQGQLLIFQDLQLVLSVDSQGGAIWSMAVFEDQVAIGCEDGFIRIFQFSAHPLDLCYQKTLERHDGRILSLDWKQDRLVAGSDQSTCRVYDSTTGKSLLRMTFDALKDQPTIVWDLKMLTTDDQDQQQHNVVVSGDSMGHVIFWDMLTGVPLKTMKVHGADVLCLAVHQNQVFSSGVDRKVIQFKKIKDTPSMMNNWVVSGEKRYHSHDVRALLWVHDRPHSTLISGGLDTLLIMSTPVEEFPHLKQYRMPFVPHKPKTLLAKSARLVVHPFESEIKVWSLDSFDSQLQTENLSDAQKIASLTPKHVLDLKLKVYLLVEKIHLHRLISLFKRVLFQIMVNGSLPLMLKEFVSFCLLEMTIVFL